MDTVLVAADFVSKKFCRSMRRSLWYGTVDLLAELTASRRANSTSLRTDEFWAVHDISFQLSRGECLALIGSNGAGKTTLLRLLNGLIKPDAGKIEVRGRVGAMIALGAGFNPILSGRENIRVNASILGLTKKEIAMRMDEIIDFAEIGEFIDAPVQSYSSGMQVRLGFAIASSLDPDLLLIDEILAVGDTRFRMKCYERMKRVLDNGAAGIFVSHNFVDVDRICNRAIHIDRGRVVCSGSVSDAVSSYQSASQRTSAMIAGESPLIVATRIQVLDASGEPKKQFETGDTIFIRVQITAATEIKNARFLLQIDSPIGMLCSISSLLSSSDLTLSRGSSEIVIELLELPLLNGVYSMWVDLYGPDVRDFLARSPMAQVKMYSNRYNPYGFGAYHTFLPRHTWRVLPHAGNDIT